MPTVLRLNLLGVIGTLGRHVQEHVAVVQSSRDKGHAHRLLHSVPALGMLRKLKLKFKLQTENRNVLVISNNNISCTRTIVYRSKIVFCDFVFQQRDRDGKLWNTTLSVPTITLLFWSFGNCIYFY